MSLQCKVLYSGDGLAFSGYGKPSYAEPTVPRPAQCDVVVMCYIVLLFHSNIYLS